VELRWKLRPGRTFAAAKSTTKAAATTFLKLIVRQKEKVDQEKVAMKNEQEQVTTFKLRCDERFTYAFTACGCVFKEIMLVGSNKGNYFENATACSKRMRKTTVAMQL